MDYWRAKSGPRTMPARGDIRPADLPGLLPYMFLIDIETEPLRLRYRLLGTALTEAVGRDSTGRYCDEICPPPAMARIEAGYRWMMAARAPVRTHGRAIHHVVGFYDYEMLHLPLSPDNDRVTMVVGGLFFEIPETL
ncbi:PAS domain-containing protein [Marinibaculum pumilum]|uniref:PAS domain-containing protein n=1 Tax=Marinibaculum pumilum TaxID=1766165 RepID=A0ABV7L5L9_9PROT